MKFRFIGVIALAGMAAACTSAGTDIPVRYGELSVALHGEPSVDVLTKAAMTLDPASDEAKEYIVRIYDSEGDEKYEASLFDFKPQTLAFGTYSVTAENCSEAEAENGPGKKRLYGCCEGVILSEEHLSQTAIIGCTVANALVSVVFDSSVSGRLEGLKVVLEGGTERNEPVVIEETPAGNVTETWFNPSTLSYTISGTYDLSGTPKPISITGSRELSARDNVKLVVRLNLENGQLAPTVSVDAEMDDPTEIPGEFNPYE